MKKVISLLLSVVMVLTMLPMTAFAAASTGGKIEFTTTFNNDLGVGDIFTVTATLSNNPGIASFTNQLQWNNQVVEFIGFEPHPEDQTLPNTSFVMGWTLATDVEDATFTMSRGTNSMTNGMLYVAKFKIIANEGALGLGLTTTKHDEKFTFANADGTDIDPELDFSDISNLTVGGKAVGPAIPEGAPFDAITLQDGSSVIDIIDMDSVRIGDDTMGYTADLYKVIIPEGAEGVKVTFPISATDLEFNKKDGEPVGVSGYADLFYEELYEGELILEQSEEGYSYIYFSDFEIKGEDTIITIPVKLEESDPELGDFSFNLERPVPDDENEYDMEYAVAGPEYGSSNNYNPICFFVFEYGAASEDDDAEPTYTITVEQPTGGTVTVDKDKATEGEEVFVGYTADNGYQFKHFLVNGEPDIQLAMNNCILYMPAEDVVISAVFELIPPTTYAITVNNADNGTVVADKTTAAAGEKVALTVAPATDYELDTLIVKQGDDKIEVVNNEFTMPAGAVTVSATFKKVVAGYRFATSADTSGNNGENVKVSVKITGHSDPQITTYNAYDITLNFDSQKLELATDGEGKYIYDGAVKSDGGEIKVDGNTIRIVGVGAPKYFDTQLAELTFKTLKTGVTKVTVGQVQVAESKEAVKDAPVAVPQHKADDTTADETPNESVIEVPYEVQKETYIGGLTKVNHGESYTFWYTETNNYTYSDLTVTVGGTSITAPTANAEGKYVIENVEGDIVISVTRTPNTYDVTFDQNLVNGDSTATYGTPYEFTVTPGDGKEVDSVSIKNNTTNDDIAYTYDSENNKYTISGGNISGAFTITVEVKDKAPTTTTITFVGDGLTSEEVEGGLTQTATIGQTFTFKLNKDSKYSYTVKIGDSELAPDQNAADTYNIPTEMVVAEGVTVTITKEEIIELKVEVKQYFNVEGKSMFLVLAKDGNKVLSYGEDTMYYSNKYKLDGETEAGAYCWLVLSTEQMNTADQVRTAAEQAIVTAADGVEAVSIKYDYDINSTGKVDINDAQLTYDMYNAHYMSFEMLSMDKFLEADMVPDGKLDTLDVANIVSHIINKK